MYHLFIVVMRLTYFPWSTLYLNDLLGVLGVFM